MLRIVLPLLITGLLVLACGSSPTYDSDVVPVPIDSNPAPIDSLDTLDGCDEAEQIAMTLSRELHAPWQLRERIRADLHRIRADWIDSVPQVAIEFWPSWPPSRLLVGVSADVYAEILNDDYRDWDSLNEIYGLDSIEFRSIHRFHWLRLQFDGCQNSERLAEAYDSLRGFAYAEPNFWVGDGPRLLALPVGNQMIYFFRNAWGDCPAGCTNSTHDVFSSTADTIVYHGHFSDIPLEDPWQSLLDEAWNRYYSGEMWCPIDRPPDTEGPISRP
jgi:hypothetical protein